MFREKDLTVKARRRMGKFEFNSAGLAGTRSLHASLIAIRVRNSVRQFLLTYRLGVPRVSALATRVLCFLHKRGRLVFVRRWWPTPARRDEDGLPTVAPRIVETLVISGQNTSPCPARGEGEASFCANWTLFGRRIVDAGFAKRYKTGTLAKVGQGCPRLAKWKRGSNATKQGRWPTCPSFLPWLRLIHRFQVGTVLTSFDIDGFGRRPGPEIGAGTQLTRRNRNQAKSR